MLTRNRCEFARVIAVERANTKLGEFLAGMFLKLLLATPGAAVIALLAGKPKEPKPRDRRIFRGGDGRERDRGLFRSGCRPKM